VCSCESMEKFDVTDLGRMRHVARIEVTQNDGGIISCQQRYAKEVLERFGLEKSNMMSNRIVPRQVIKRLCKRNLGCWGRFSWHNWIVITRGVELWMIERIHMRICLYACAMIHFMVFKEATTGNFISHKG
jgi:hypothetical protein